ncbi:MAG TPA: RNA polymerase sigma factor [Pyrinomonadaceae bacterium]|nr:RNA polymerase sigma factor [Pyrinomonadaceae bacterium]
MKQKTDLTDAELLRLMLSGDEESFTLLYKRRHASIYRFALQMSGSQQTAEDVTHDVFLFLMKDGHVFDPARGSVSSFLFGVARNYVLRRFRGDHLTVPFGEGDEEAFEQVVTEPGLLEDLTKAETIENVRRAVLSLPERYREVVVLCELQELSYGETAEILGCAIGTVRSRLHRARALLLAKLRPGDEKDIASSAAVGSARCFA